MGQEPRVKRLADSRKEVSYWKTAQSIWGEPHFYQKVKEFPMELIAVSTFRKMQEFISKPHFTVEEAAKLNPSLGAFVSWILGVYEFHQYLRKYCERDFDAEVLDPTELEFLHVMDTRMYKNFKIFKYVSERCTEFKEIPFVAQKLALNPQFKLDS